MKQEKRKLTLFTTEDTVKKWNLPVNQLIICRYLCIYCSCFIYFFMWFQFFVWVLNFACLNLAGIFIRRSLISRFFHNRENREIK